MPASAAVLGGEPAGSGPAGDTGRGAGRAAVPASPLGRLVLGFGFLFVLFVEPCAAAVLKPHADVGLDRFVAGEPQRLDLRQPVRLACRNDEHRARRFRFLRPLQRDLTPPC